MPIVPILASEREEDFARIETESEPESADSHYELPVRMDDGDDDSHFELPAVEPGYWPPDDDFSACADD